MTSTIRESGEPHLGRITAGLSRDEAVGAFLAACNRRDTLFLTERWLAERLPPIRDRLSDRLDDDEALALRELARMHVKSGEVIGWLRDRTTSWTEYHERFSEERHRAKLLSFSRGMLPFAWGDVEACADNEDLQHAAFAEPGRKTRSPDQMTGCPACHSPLQWIYFRSPDWTWRELCGRSGWLAICGKCRIQADFEMTSMS